MKIIFLDIDGVLNDKKFMIENKNNFDRKSGKYLEIDEEKVKLLSEIVNFTGAKIVLSSAWRMFWNNENLTPNNIKSILLTELFNKYGLCIYDMTPYDSIREKEIDSWLKKHPEVESFIVIDDDLEHVKKFENTALIKTSYYDETSGGLNEEHVKEAINILTRNK